jgi:hypothetical protein
VHAVNALPKRLKLTVPLDGTAIAGRVGLTVAVKVTDWEKADAGLLETTTVVSPALLTVWVIPGEVLVRNSVSPLNTAVIDGVPTGVVRVEHAADPLVTAVDPQPAIEVPLILKSTLPPTAVAVAGDTGVIVAV